ncbi:hypothetical protein IAR55_001190 [Kwoniella newhampshirensis]|uniref:Alpha-ketoglutarate-dependent dioxygenase AlkB-like domain-containing protein n=1 Tax=Kwoniella newhampshirensis TaxID=1651941 RepID=A0AAW0Z531_9TREE
MPSLPDTSHTPFRLTEKHFKNRIVKNHLPSLRSHIHALVDLSRPTRQEDDEVWTAGWWSPDHDAEPSRRGKERNLGERPELDTTGLKRITLSDGRIGYIVAPGCILIPRYLTPLAQLALLESSLALYTLPPNPLSLSTHYDLPHDLFHLYATAPDTLVQPKHASVPASHPPPKCRTIVDTEPAAVLGYDEIVARNKSWTGDVPSDKLGPKTVDHLMRQIRWANLGWVYQVCPLSPYNPLTPSGPPNPTTSATTRRSLSLPISPRSAPPPSPPSPGTMSSPTPPATSHGPMITVRHSYPTPLTTAPDTGIVNFYQLNDTLMGHVDRSELGHAAILLLGASTRHSPPRPIILRSGDMLIMSGDGRQAYHGESTFVRLPAEPPGIPRIMERTLPAHFSPIDTPAKRWISTARININARQVFPPGFQRPIS